MKKVFAVLFLFYATTSAVSAGSNTLTVNKAATITVALSKNLTNYEVIFLQDADTVSSFHGRIVPCKPSETSKNQTVITGDSSFVSFETPQSSRYNSCLVKAHNRNHTLEYECLINVLKGEDIVSLPIFISPDAPYVLDFYQLDGRLVASTIIPYSDVSNGDDWYKQKAKQFHAPEGWCLCPVQPLPGSTIAYYPQRNDCLKRRVWISYKD